MEGATISKAARRAGVGIETIRFYERRGLIRKPPRPTSGYRQYPEDTVFRIRFIKRAKELGFTLEEIKNLLELRIDSSKTCEDVRRHADKKISDIEEKIQSLRRMKKALAKLKGSCSGRGPVSECPILESLED